MTLVELNFKVVKKLNLAWFKKRSYIWQGKFEYQKLISRINGVMASYISWISKNELNFKVNHKNCLILDILIFKFALPIYLILLLLYINCFIKIFTRMPPSIQDWNIDAEQIKDIFYCQDIHCHRFPKIALMIIEEHGLEIKTQRYSPTNTGFKNMVINNKLLLKSGGEWQLEIGQVAISKFSNREQFDLIVDGICEKFMQKMCNVSTVDKISILEALATMTVSLIEYDSTQDEFFNDEIIDLLGGKCFDDETNPETGATKCMLRDFRAVKSQRIKATAQRGSFYLYFDYFSSWLLTYFTIEFLEIIN